MSETSNNVEGIVQPFGLCQEYEKHPLEVAGTSMKLCGGYVLLPPVPLVKM